MSPGIKPLCGPRGKALRRKQRCFYNEVVNQRANYFIALTVRLPPPGDKAYCRRPGGSPPLARTQIETTGQLWFLPPPRTQGENFVVSRPLCVRPLCCFPVFLCPLRDVLEGEQRLSVRPQGNYGGSRWTPYRSVRSPWGKPFEYVP